jgi:riboflavin kinase/FMN adenylyltransferase
LRIEWEHPIRSLLDVPAALTCGAVAIGNFDGVHRGHARLIERLRRKADEVGGPATVLTFEPHPVVLLRPDAAPPPLTWAERKADLLADLGVDAVVIQPTDLALLSLTAREFFECVVLQCLRAKAVVEGPNFRFGRDRAGDILVLDQLCAQAGVVLDIVEPLTVGDGLVSSSRIRERIRLGDVDAARAMLTQPYRTRGMVVHGARRGGALGFPTANLEAVDTLIPGMGVYAGRAYTAAESWPAAVNIGPNPTFGEHGFKFEIHLVGFTGSLYGQPLEVDFLSRLRDIQPFPSSEDLKHQLQVDIRAVCEITNSTSRG